MTFHAILASHNRRELTLKSLRSLFSSSCEVSSLITATLFDDGSVDGTIAEVEREFRNVTTIVGDGTAFWAAAMAAAESDVLARPDVMNEDYVVWFNDDVELDNDAVRRLEACIRVNPESIVVGAVRDPKTGSTAYSGLRKAGPHPLNYSKVDPDPVRSLAVDTFNGNLVAVPVYVARSLGGIDGKFSHAFADIDYGLRAQQNGISVTLAPGTFGTCAPNPVPPRGSVMDDWRKFVGRKGGGNFASISRILRKIRPHSWPVFVAATYSLWWVRQLRLRVMKYPRI